MSARESDRLLYRARRIREGPLRGALLFGAVFAAQLGHVSEHIAVAVQGTPLLGPAFDTEVSHFLFNLLIGALAVLLVIVFFDNPWVYPLAALALVHALDHALILHNFLETNVVNAPGLLGQGSLLDVPAIGRIDLHNAYNGLELVLMVLGFTHEIDQLLDVPKEFSMQARLPTGSTRR